MFVCVIAAKSQKLRNQSTSLDPTGTEAAAVSHRDSPPCTETNPLWFLPGGILCVSPLAAMWASASSSAREREAGDSDAVEEFGNGVTEDAGGVRAAVDFRRARR